jgi:GT2 family glycosyltransferase
MGKVAAVIVTYNRLDMLQECLQALAQQTYLLTDIIVVNNGSTDGTANWLDQQTDLIAIHQGNSGSAGGFYTGIKAADERGYDWIWIMDDDGYPALNCLEQLIAASTKRPEINVWGCMVLDRDKPTQLAFECQAITNNIGEINTHIEFIDNWAPFFNGILLSAGTVKKIGYPNQGLFIWGDEFDYFQRVIAAGNQIASTTKALFYHPKDRLYATKYRGQYVYDGAINWRAYCFFRNRAYVGRKYFNSTRSIILLNQFAYWHQKLSFKDFVKAVLLTLKAHIDGLSYNLKKKLPY